MKGITTGPLEVRNGLLGWQVEGKGDDGTYVVARFYEEAAEANARAFVMVEEMVGVLRALAGIENAIEDRHALDDDLAMINYKHIRNARAILAHIDGSMTHD